MLPPLAFVADGFLLHDLAIHQDTKLPVALIMGRDVEAELVQFVLFYLHLSLQRGRLVLRERVHEQHIRAAMELGELHWCALEIGRFDIPLRIPQAHAFPINRAGVVTAWLLLRGLAAFDTLAQELLLLLRQRTFLRR